MNSQTIIILVILTIIIITFMCFNYKLYDSKHFTTTISLVAIFALFVTLVGVYGVNENYENSVYNSGRAEYNSIMKDIFVFFSDYFTRNVDMMYLFHELYNNEEIECERDIMKEQLFFFLLFGYISKYCDYYYRHLQINSHVSFVLRYNRHILKFLELLSRNATFKKHLMEYLDKTGSGIIIRYMKEFKFC